MTKLLIKSLSLLFSLLTLTALLMFAVIPANAQSSDKKQEALIAREKSYFDAVEKKQYDFLDALLAEDYIGTYGLGIFDKTREKKDLREFPLTDYQMSEIKTAFPNSKTGIISFKLHVTVLVNGKEFSEDDFINCVWTEHGKKWLLSSQTAVKLVKS